MKIFKTTRKVNSDKNIEVAINRSKHVLVHTVHVTLPALTTNYVRDVRLRRKDETMLGEETVEYRTSEVASVIFTEDFILPAYDPICVVDTATMALATDVITFEAVYEEIKL